MWEILLPILGLLIAIIATMTGVGGGLIVVPLLTLAYGFLPSHAIGTSLAVIVFTGFSASLNYARQKRVFFRTGLLLATATVPGSIVGALLTSVLPGNILGLIFGIFLIIVAIRMIVASKILRKKKTELNTPRVVHGENDLFLDRKRLVGGICLGFFGGFASGLLGIGGGILLVPIMTLILLMPIHLAVATSMFTMIFTSLSGVLQHWTLGNVNMEYALLLAVGALAGAQVGAWLCKKTSGEKLSLLFAVLVLVVSVQMIAKYI